MMSTRDYPVRTISDAIARGVATAGDSPALVGADSRQISFAQLSASIASFAGQLADAGLCQEERVGLLVPPGAAGGELVVALACNIALVPMNPALTFPEVMDAVEASGIRAVVVPGWMETPARSKLLEQPIAVFEAALAPDGALSLHLLTAAAGPPVPVRGVTGSDVALLLRSSGTTGAPKLIPVTHGNLLAMAEKLGSDFWYGLGTTDRAACTAPLYYAAGLKTTLFVPLILGASVAFPPTGRAMEIAEWIDVLKPTYLSVAPGPLNAIVDRLKASGREFESGSLRFVMCGSAYLPEELRSQAQALLHAPVVEFYGLSEAGIMAANSAPPGKNKPGTVGLPAPGELLVVDENREPVANGITGEIMVSGATVMPDYIVTDGSNPGELKDGWLLTGDLGRIDEEGYLTIVGRLKEVIDRGGEKIFPYELEKALLEHPAVAEAAAFGVPHPRLGENAAAAAVLKPGSKVTEHELKVFLAQRLAAFKLPRRLWLVASLPRGDTGKVSRKSLREIYAAVRRDVVEPEAWLEFELLDLWRRLLGTNGVGIDDDFFDKGGDSLLAAEMLIEVERLAGKPYPQSELSTFTVRHIAEVITSGLSADRDVVTQVKEGPGIPLFFCHGDYVARGLYAQKLAALLPEEQPLFLLHCYPDRMLGSSVEEIAEAYLQEVLRKAPDSPVFVGGYCNGGLVAWHLAHLLRARGVTVVELLLIDTLSLGARPGLRALPRLVAAAGNWVPGRAGGFLREDAMRVIWMLRRNGIAGSTILAYRAARRRLHAALGLKLPQPRQPRNAPYAVTKMYFQFISRYVPPRADVDVTCFIAEQGSHFDTKPGLWRGLAASVKEVRVPGTHHTMLMSERQALAAAIAQDLAQATARYLMRQDLRSPQSSCSRPAYASTAPRPGPSTASQPSADPS